MQYNLRKRCHAHQKVNVSTQFLGCHFSLREDFLQVFPLLCLTHIRFLHLTLYCQVEHAQGQECWSILGVSGVSV